MFNAGDIKKDFPILETKMNGKPLVYLDNAATSQKPECVISALNNFYKTSNANVHRGVYDLAVKATEHFEKTRDLVRDFINAQSREEIIFTKGTTESINLVAYSWGYSNIIAGDEIVLSGAEHHSNLVPWQELSKKKKAVLKLIPVDEKGLIDEALIEPGNSKSVITRKTKLVAVTQMSNVLGTVMPVKKITMAAKKVGAVVLVDGAQSVPHMPVDVRDSDCDFLAFSAHKMLGPTGVGVLYGKKDLLSQMDPFLFGGEMIKEVHEQSAEWNDLPYKFEAGTPDFADVSAFAEALEYLKHLGLEDVYNHGFELRKYAYDRLSQMQDLIIYGPTPDKPAGGIISFNIKGVHAHDVASILDSEGVAVRAGHHCAQPLMEKFGVSSTVRMSFYIYNTREDVDRAVTAIKKVYEIFKIS